MEENRIRASQQLERVEYTQLLPPDLQVDGKVHKVDNTIIVVVMIIMIMTVKATNQLPGLQLNCVGFGRRDSVPHRLQHQIRPQ